MLGSVEASAFTADQLRMIAEFVDVRGGGLLMLGGHRSFTEGGYGNTPVSDVMPVVLGRLNPPLAELKIRPTRAGEAHAVTQLGDTEQASAERWKVMPPLTTVNLIESIKPGATTLLSANVAGRERIVLAYERYGRGKSIAFPVQDSWHWQMDATIRVEDQTHENFWRQLLRWLVDGVPDGVETRPLTDRVEPGQPVALTADVVDKRFVELNDAAVVAHVTSPSGKTVDVPMQWTGERNGQYRANIETTEAGWYKAKVDAIREGQTGRVVDHARARDSGRRGVFRRGDARADAQANRAGHGRPLLYGRCGHDAGRRSEVLGPRRHRGRGARALAHAGVAAGAGADHLHRVGSAPVLEAGVSGGARGARGAGARGARAVLHGRARVRAVVGARGDRRRARRLA